jgi:hypothetical protein
MGMAKTITMAGETCYSIGGLADRSGVHVDTTKRRRKAGQLPPHDFIFQGREFWKGSTLDRFERELMDGAPSTETPTTGRQRQRRKAA